jgi:hypothetical protein
MQRAIVESTPAGQFATDDQQQAIRGGRVRKAGNAH